MIVLILNLWSSCISAETLPDEGLLYAISLIPRSSFSLVTVVLIESSAWHVAVAIAQMKEN